MEEEVLAVLKERGFKFPTFRSEKQRQAFIAEHRYNPAIVLNSSLKMAEVFPRDWKKRLGYAPGHEPGGEFVSA